MLHPLFSTLIQRPDLVADHVAAYGSLFVQEATDAGEEVLTKVIAWLVAVLAGVVFLGLVGTAVMLGVLGNHFHWVLVAVPGVALLLTTAAVLRAQKPFVNNRFLELKAQIDSDAKALRMAA
jgi:peptidoglycan/LPS O-acetylase OafA/YrhL